MAKFRPVKAVIFDMDGTILDTEKLYGKIFEDICKKYNKTFPYETRVKVLGRVEEEAGAITIKDCQLPCTLEEFRKDFHKLTMQRMSSGELLPGSERLIRHLHKYRIPIALATSSDADLVDVKTRHYRELFSLFHHKVMGSSDPELKCGKPAPDIFLLAAERFDEPIDPRDCLVIEDAPSGVQAALAAGMQCCFVPNEFVPKELKKDADLILWSLNGFQPEFFGLPPYNA